MVVLLCVTWLGSTRNTDLVAAVAADGEGNTTRRVTSGGDTSVANRIVKCLKL